MLKSFRYFEFEEIESTNTYALNMINTYDIQKKTNFLNKSVIISNKQTKGRGRMNRSFYSSEMCGLYMSVIYYPKQRIISPALITPLAAVAVNRALKKLWNVDSQIKWVNDIYIDSKKVCGILAEGHVNTKQALIDSVVVGFGLNLFKTKFPDEIAEKAGCIFPDKDFTSDEKVLMKKEIADCILQEFFDLLKYEDSVCSGKIQNCDELQIAMKEYHDKSNVIGKTVELFPVINKQESFKALILDITDNGQLKIQKEDGKIHFYDTGEISMSFV